MAGLPANDNVSTWRKAFSRVKELLRSAMWGVVNFLLAVLRATIDDFLGFLASLKTVSAWVCLLSLMGLSSATALSWVVPFKNGQIKRLREQVLSAELTKKSSHEQIVAKDAEMAAKDARIAQLEQAVKTQGTMLMDLPPAKPKKLKYKKPAPSSWWDGLTGSIN